MEGKEEEVGGCYGGWDVKMWERMRAWVVDYVYWVMDYV